MTGTTFTRWTIGMLQDQGAQNTRSLADLTGWPLRRCQLVLNHLQRRQLVTPVNLQGARRWQLVDRPDLRFWGPL